MPSARLRAAPSRVAHAVHRRAIMGTYRHVHHRVDGVAVICTSAWCAPSRGREIASRALLIAAPLAAVAAACALGPRWFGVALALLALVAYVACEARAGGARLDRDVRAANTPRAVAAAGRVRP